MFFLSAPFAFLCAFCKLFFPESSTSCSASLEDFPFPLPLILPVTSPFFSSRPSYLNILFHFFYLLSSSFCSFLFQFPFPLFLSLTFLFVSFFVSQFSFSLFFSLHFLFVSLPSYLTFLFLLSCHFIFHFVVSYLSRNLISRLILLTFVCCEITFSSLTNFRTLPPPSS